MAKKKSVNTKQISTVAEYLEWVKNIHDKHANVKVFYRGMADRKWKITPSLFRYQTKKTEKELLQSATNLIWNELKDTTTYLEKLIILQHYGFPTRLLDVTTNPLVALYFACWKEEEMDGSVYVGFTNNLDNNASIERICNLLFEEDLEQESVKLTDWTPGKLLRLFSITREEKQEQLKYFEKMFRLHNHLFQLQPMQQDDIVDELCDQLLRWLDKNFGVSCEREKIFFMIKVNLICDLNKELRNDIWQTYLEDIYKDMEQHYDFYADDILLRCSRHFAEILHRLFNQLFDKQIWEDMGLLDTYNQIYNKQEELKNELRKLMVNKLYWYSGSIYR